MYLREAKNVFWQEKSQLLGGVLKPSARKLKCHKYLVLVVVLDDVPDRVDGPLVGVGEAAAGSREEL